MKHFLLLSLVLLAGCPNNNPLDYNADVGIPSNAKVISKSGPANSNSADGYIPSYFDGPRYSPENWFTWQYVKGNSVKSLRKKKEGNKWLYRLEVNSSSPPIVTYFETEDPKTAEREDF